MDGERKRERGRERERERDGPRDDKTAVHVLPAEGGAAVLSVGPQRREKERERESGSSWFLGFLMVFFLVQKPFMDKIKVPVLTAVRPTCSLEFLSMCLARSISISDVAREMA
jgi:hypothetical protein